MDIKLINKVEKLEDYNHASSSIDTIRKVVGYLLGYIVVGLAFAQMFK